MAQVIDLAARRKRALSLQREVAARDLLSDWAFVGRRFGPSTLLASALLAATPGSAPALAYTLFAAGTVLWAGVVLEACRPIAVAGPLERLLVRRR